jgi:hypothetical protein
VIFNANFNILKQFNCTLVGQIKDLITSAILDIAFPYGFLSTRLFEINLRVIKGKAIPLQA